MVASADMQTDTPADRTAAAREAALRTHAAAAANDSRKLAKALRVVRAALDQGLITIDDITSDDAADQLKASV